MKHHGKKGTYESCSQFTLSVKFLLYWKWQVLQWRWYNTIFLHEYVPVVWSQPWAYIRILSSSWCRGIIKVMTSETVRLIKFTLVSELKLIQNRASAEQIYTSKPRKLARTDLYTWMFMGCNTEIKIEAKVFFFL